MSSGQHNISTLALSSKGTDTFQVRVRVRARVRIRGRVRVRGRVGVGLVSHDALDQ